jgi:hypothetical protein
VGTNWPGGEQAWALDPVGKSGAHSERLDGRPEVIGGLADLSEAIRIHKIQEVILSGRDVSAGQIIDAMSSAAARGVNFRIAWSDTEPLMGSGGPVAVPLTNLRRSLQSRSVRRQKRLFDVVASGLILPVSPLLWASGRRGWGRRAWQVLAGPYTWVGYAGAGEGLPRLRSAWIQLRPEGDDRMLRRMDLAYARDYRWTIDLSVVVQALISHRGI